MEIQELYKLFLQANGITTDTRKIEKNQIYFALKGEQFNGNSFAEKSIELGASYAVIDEEQYAINEYCILVDDVLATLQQLANYHLHQVKPKAVIAITGSNGKTTTKELVHAVLETSFRTHYTKGNLNNHIGIPLTLLEMKADTEIAVIEMGANHQQEITNYCAYVEPTHGIITNCGKAHMEGFGGIEGIQRGKGELYDYIKSTKGTIFVNGDDAILLKMATTRDISSVITYGNNKDNKYHSIIEIDNPFLRLNFEGTIINSNLFGSYNYSNIMCAIAVGKYFDIENQKIKFAIEQYHSTNARSQVIKKDGYELILDAYNANPTSMQHALESFTKATSKNKIVILGDMFELGEYTAEEHQKIANLATALHFDKIILVGKAFHATHTIDAVLKFTNALEAQQWFRQQSFSDASILLKGSRSMKMEKVIE
ncbi:MAG TPA: UDP-N-acetylmuramoyl-tripeptide--D-alanyl-D-alanine ligase [Chitinophagales bacterium]|nr:UDP-N-acetylmuramoyl-tripeptide--D-alanyl-D-alanine ligase [Chitinophagales bacterium]